MANAAQTSCAIYIWSDRVCDEIKPYSGREKPDLKAQPSHPLVELQAGTDLPTKQVEPVVQ